MEFLFDLLPLLVIYALVRAFSRTRKPAAPSDTVATADEAPAARTGFEQLLEALAAAQAPAEPSAGLPPAEPPDRPTVTPPPRPRPNAAAPLRPTHRPRPPQKHVGALSFEKPPFDERAAFDAAAPLGGRFYDDAGSFDRAIVRPADEHAGIDRAGFETASFTEHGLRGHRPVAPPAPGIPRSAAGVAERLRNPATAREAFVMQMLLERRGRRR